MKPLTPQQKELIKEYLDQQGLDFQPLRAEIEDHLLSDLAFKIHAGSSFEEAWLAITQPIQETHFSHIQQQTMESIQKRLSLSNFLINISIGLLFIASLFKVLHFPGTIMLMLGSLLSLGVSFLVTSISSIRRNTDKKRAGLMILTLSAVLLFWTSWLFGIIQLPGMMQMRTISILMLLGIFPLLQRLINQRADTSQEMIVYLHEKASNGLNRLILTVLALAVLLKLFSISMNYPPEVAAVFAAMTLIITGFHLFATLWHNQYNEDIKQHSWLSMFIIGLFALYFVPALGSIIPLEVRAIMVHAFYLGLGYLVFFRWNQSNTTTGTLSYLVMSTFLTFWLVYTLGWSGDALEGRLFNLPVLIVFTLFLLLLQKGSIQRLLWVMIIAHFLFEYPFPGMLW